MNLTENDIKEMTSEDIIGYIIENSSFNELLYMIQYGNKPLEIYDKITRI